MWHVQVLNPHTGRWESICWYGSPVIALGMATLFEERYGHPYCIHFGIEDMPSDIAWCEVAEANAA